MYHYDLTIVLDGKMTPAKRKAAQEKLEKMVEVFEGKLGKLQDLGEKELSYPIKKATTGIYLNYPLELKGENAKKLNDKLRIDESFLRFLLVRTNEKTVVKE